MRIFFGRRFWLIGWLAAAGAVEGRAQPATLALTTERTAVAIETTTPVQALAAWSLTVTGLQLTAGTVTPPSADAAVALEVGSGGTQLSASARFVPDSTLVAPSAQLDAAYPGGDYAVRVDWTKLTGSSAAGDYALTLAADWPPVPVCTAPQPLYPIAGSEATFAWNAWTGAGAGASIGFTLYEGNLSIDLLQELAAGDYSGLESLSVVNVAPSLAADTVAHVVSGIDPQLDHLLVLEFDDVTTVTGVPLRTVRRSSRVVIYYYRDTVLSYDSWLAQFFSGEEIAAGELTAPEADPDGDGVENLLEYAFVMDPTMVGRAGPGLPQALTVDGVPVVEFLRANGVDLAWSYERLAADGTWVTMAPGDYVETVVVGAGDYDLVKVTPAEGTADGGTFLMRVVVTLAR